MNEPTESPSLDKGERERAVDLARSAVESEFGLEPGEPRGDPLERRGGVFVTLKKAQDLRGCIGSPLSDEPLEVSIPDSAERAAFEDPRFPPLRRREVGSTVFEVTVLTTPEPVEPGDVEVGRHGLMVGSGPAAGLLLPQVPVEQGWGREEFLEGVCRKAGLPPGTWRSATLKAFEGQVFREAEPRGEVREE